MPKCSECGTPTDLHELDVPICPDCIAARGCDEPSVQTLAEEFQAAKEHYRREMLDFEKRRDGPELDRGTEVQAAKQTYLNALRVYGDALRRHAK
jgi:hypothetical protein